tara:strand:+ start:1906 stop:2685 length:780 start_codon:yes stop_codon:yes gene_type:complete
MATSTRDFFDKVLGQGKYAGQPPRPSRFQPVETDFGMVSRRDDGTFIRPLGVSAFDFNPQTGGLTRYAAERKRKAEQSRAEAQQKQRARELESQRKRDRKQSAIQGLQNLYASYTLFGEPGQAGIDDVRSYIQRNIASGNFNQDDIPGVIFNFATNKPQQGELQRLREASTGQALNPFGNIPAAPRPVPQSSRPAGTLTRRGDSLFGSEGQFLGTYGGPSGNTFTPGLTKVDQIRMDKLKAQQSRIDEFNKTYGYGRRN